MSKIGWLLLKEQRVKTHSFSRGRFTVARHGRMNGRARKTIVVYKGQEYVFDYCRQAINYFKEFKGEPITVNWIYRGINPNYQDRFQFFGYEEDYKKYKENKALAI